MEALVYVLRLFSLGQAILAQQNRRGLLEPRHVDTFEVGFPDLASAARALEGAVGNTVFAGVPVGDVGAVAVVGLEPVVDGVFAGKEGRFARRSPPRGLWPLLSASRGSRCSRLAR
jgi:hypothetical protein